MGQSFSVVVIGLGYFSQFHLAAWQANKHATLVGVSDLSADKCAAAKQNYGVAAHVDAPTLLRDMQPDIVDIIAPPVAHARSLSRAKPHRPAERVDPIKRSAILPNTGVGVPPTPFANPTHAFSGPCGRPESAAEASRCCHTGLGSERFRLATLMPETPKKRADAPERRGS